MFSHYSIIPIVQILFCSLVYHSSIRFSFSCSPTQDSLIDYQVPANQCHKMRKTPYQIPSSTFSLTLYSCSSYRCAPRGRLPLLAILQRVRRVHLPLGCWKTQKHREKKTARSPPPKQYMFIINTATTSAYQRISLTALHKTVNARHLNTELSIFKGDASPIIITTKRNVFTNLCRAWLYPETCTGRTSITNPSKATRFPTFHIFQQATGFRYSVTSRISNF
jgi:hypothetical protein